jgi:hypothetical protein
MEQVIFLHADEDSEATLSQMQRSLAQRLVLVAPAQMDRLRLSLLLRLARRYIGARAKYLCVISEDPLAQLLAKRMGFTVASTLDEYRGLAPRPGPSSGLRYRPVQTRPAQPTPRPSIGEEPSPSGPLPAVPTSGAPGIRQAPAAPASAPTGTRPEKPSANLEKMLEDGYLPNPAATPDLEEEEELAAREEEEERLFYEIDDEEPPSRAQQEAERHEEQITTRILTSRSLGPAQPEPPAPASQPPEQHAASNEQATQHTQNWEASLRPMRTIDDLLRERGRGEVFDWFQRQATPAGTASASSHNTSTTKTAVETLAPTSPAADAPAPARHQPPATAPGHPRRWLGMRARLPKPTLPRLRGQPRPPGPAPWRRFGIIGVIGALTLSLLMTGTAIALIPSAQVILREEISPYNETLLLDARPAGLPLQAEPQPDALASAEVARFDGVVTAPALATGQRAAPNDPNHLLAFPTVADVDEMADHLRALAQQWGEQALKTQAGPDDILGPIITNEQTLAFPPIGASLPDGVSRFRVSVAIHLQATLLRHAALLQATQQQVRADVNRARPGFAPQLDQSPHVSILSVEPAGPGAAQLELLVRVQVQAMIGPALTPDQARQAIAGKDVDEATAYLQQQPGVTQVFISVQPKWPNRLPIFSANIRIVLER